MAITAAPGYEIDPTNPNSVRKIGSAAMPGSVAAIQQSNQQPSIAFGAVNTGPVPVSTLTSNAQPFVPPPQPPMPQVAPIVTGAITGATTPPPVTTPTSTPTETMSFSDRLKTMLGSDVNTFLSKPTSLADTRTSLRGEYDIAGKEKAVNDLSAQLASITAKYQTAPLILEREGQGRVTTDILNRQQAQAQRDYAIEALPVTAALNAAQGRLDSANKNITELLGVIKEDQDTTYQYQKDVLSSAMDIASEDQKRELEARSLQLEMAKYDAEQFNKVNQGYVDAAIKAGDYATAGKIATATSFEEMAGLIGAVQVTPDTQYIEIGGRKLLVDKKGNVLKDMGSSAAPGSGSTVNNQITDNERALMSQFRGEQIVKDYNTILSQKGTIDNYIQNGVGGPADLALVFSFMKGLDPNSVVRETEYANAAKSGNIFQGAFAKFNGYFKEKGGILPDSVKSEFQNLVNLKLKTQENLYTNVVNSYKGIAERQGLNPSNVVIDYAQANTAPTSTVQTSKYDSYVDDINEQGVMKRSAWATVTDKDGLLAYMRSLGVDLKISD